MTRPNYEDSVKGELPTTETYIKPTPKLAKFRASIRIENKSIYAAVAELEGRGYSVSRAQDMSGSHISDNLAEPLVNAMVDFEELNTSEAIKKLSDEGYRTVYITKESDDN